MNLSDPNDVHYLYNQEFGDWPKPEKPKTELDRIYEDLKQMRYGGAMDEGEDLRTCLICVTNKVLELMDYLRRDHERTNRQGDK